MTTYDEAVTEFRQLDDEIENDQWRQAQIAAELFRAGASQVKIAADVSKSPRHISTLCRMWERHSESTSKPEFNSTYQEAAEGADWQEKQAVRRAKSALAQLPPEQKAAVIEDASDELPPEQQAQLVDRWLEEDERRRRGAAPLSPVERQQVRDEIQGVERTARERGLANQREHDQLTGGMELLADVTHARDALDAVVTKWSRRSVNLAPQEVAALDGEVAAIHRTAGQLAEFRHGREDVDDELQRLVKDVR